MPVSSRPPHVAVTFGVAALMTLGTWSPAPPLFAAMSLLGALALALATRRLLLRLGTSDANRAAALVFVLPGVALNAGLLGQGDAIGAAPLLMALVAALDRRHRTMLAWCGLAVGFKAQAVLIAPFFVAVLINRGVPLRRWPIAPAVAAATMLLAWATGLATIAPPQADGYTALSLDAPNIWAIVQSLPLGVPLLGLALATAIGAIAAYIAYFSARPLGDRALVSAALLCTLVTAGLLPHMHERCFFLADILSLVLALATRDRAGWRIALLVQAGSALALLGFVGDVDAAAMLGAIVMILATIQLARPLLQPAANDNPLPARTVWHPSRATNASH